MKAVVYRRYGGPEVLEYTDVPDPKLSQNSVLVRVRAAALNPADPAWARATPTPGFQSSPDGMSPASSSRWGPGSASLRRAMR